MKLEGDGEAPASARRHERILELCGSVTQTRTL